MFQCVRCAAVIALVVPRFRHFHRHPAPSERRSRNRMREKLQATLVELRNRGLVTRRLPEKFALHGGIVTIRLQHCAVCDSMTPSTMNLTAPASIQSSWNFSGRVRWLRGSEAAALAD